ncbi:Uncharacterised protein [Mycobacteroides abscessus subsp. abscessus]|nr:Uncharacterised protein [Mycobacteroides abscessus subsp. abscessus]
MVSLSTPMRVRNTSSTRNWAMPSAMPLAIRLPTRTPTAVKPNSAIPIGPPAVPSRAIDAALLTPWVNPPENPSAMSRPSWAAWPA